jgi:hypothetical protein
MPGPLLALAGRLAASRGGQAIARAGAAGGRAARATKARIGRAIGPKGRKLAKKYGKKARRELDLMGDLYSDQWNRDQGRDGPKAAKAIRKAELLRGILGGKKYFSGKGGAEAGAIPAKKTPKTAKEVTKPSISAINDQLGDLLKVVTHIRDISKDRQNTLIKNEVDAVRASDEEHLESNIAANDNEGPDAIPEPANDNDSSQLSNTFDAFSEALDSLTQTIQDLIDNQGTGGGEEQQPGFGDLFMENFRRGKGYKGTRFSPGSIVGKSQARLSGMATNVRQSVTSRGIGNVIKTGAGNAAAKMARGAGTTRDAVRRLARPILAKSIGKTALKSIPLIGAAAGAVFAIGKLLDGDFVGAGLEAASGLAGPATAIPAFILSVSRDIYSGVYGVPPEQDPQFAERMPEIEEAVKAEAASIMSPQVETKEGVTNASGGQATPTSNPQQQMQQMAEKASAPAMAGGATSSPTPASAPAGAPTAGAGAPPAASSGAPAGGAPATPTSGGPAASSTPPAPTTSSTATPTGPTSPDAAGRVNQPSSSVSTNTPQPPAQPAAVNQTSNSASVAGEQIIRATEKSEDAANRIPTINVGRNGQPPRPQRFPTERQGFTGTGNVPNPGLDNMGTIAYQLYFGVAA